MSMKMVNIDNELWKRFYKKCVKNDITMKNKISELVQGYVEGED